MLHTKLVMQAFQVFSVFLTKLLIQSHPPCNQEFGSFTISFISSGLLSMTLTVFLIQRRDEDLLISVALIKATCSNVCIIFCYLKIKICEIYFNVCISTCQNITQYIFWVTHSVVDSKRSCMYTICKVDLIKMCGNEVFHPSRVP